MLERFKYLMIGVLIGGWALMFVSLSHAKKQRNQAITQLTQLTAQVNLQNIAIKNAQEEADKFTVRAEKYQKEADDIARKSQKNVNDVMMLPIESGCEGAIKFGIEQAIKIKAS